MKLCKFGLHRWEEEEGGAFESTVKRCTKCGTVVKENPVATEYRIPEGADSRIVKVNKNIFLMALGGLLLTALIVLKRRK